MGANGGSAMAARFGRDNPNYRHGGYCNDLDTSDIKICLAKNLLERILTTPCDHRGELPFPQSEQQWAMRVCRQRPEWALPVLDKLGIKPFAQEV